jgi:hypothetical protein
MRYEFSVLSGAVVSGRRSSSSKPPEIGSTIWVLYDPERPKLNRPYPLSLVRLADAAKS